MITVMTNQLGSWLAIRNKLEIVLWPSTLRPLTSATPYTTVICLRCYSGYSICAYLGCFDPMGHIVDDTSAETVQIYKVIEMQGFVHTLYSSTSHHGTLQTLRNLFIHLHIPRCLDCQRAQHPVRADSRRH